MKFSVEIEQSLNALMPISLEQLDANKLMNRIDTKFIFNTALLSEILERVKNDYQVLEIENRRVFNYESLYFDTQSFKFYNDHHNGRPNRTKVRYRKYVDTGDVYFEVKQRVKDFRTDKHRIKRDEIYTELKSEETNLLDELHINELNLEEKIWILYKRITLSSISTLERVTIDLNMEFDTKNNHKEFPDLIVAEVKQDRFSRTSSFVSALRKCNIPSFRISKYAIAIAMMEENIKANEFKGKINKLFKVTNGNSRSIN